MLLRFSLNAVVATVVATSASVPATPISEAVYSPSTRTCTSGTPSSWSTSDLVKCVDYLVQNPAWTTYTCAGREWSLTPAWDDEGGDTWSPAQCVEECKSCMYDNALKGLEGATCTTEYGMWY
ncbi:hypothetical protein IQ06DRAFT_296318 [Phaeosphaeriaceae sp. SRC1lsM3a]|nr:hypothetical protein IQ06DRAFT_296318 [Stagonospora sp. SRC1lsM3a]